MTWNRTGVAIGVLVLCGGTTETETFSAGKPGATRLGSVKIDSRGLLHFKFGESATTDRRIELTDVYSHDGVRYEGQALRTLVDWLSRRTKPTPVLLLANAVEGDVEQFVEANEFRISDRGLIFVPRTTPRSVPKKKPAATEVELLRLVNATRRQYGLQPLTLSSGLCAACDDHSRTMAAYGFFSHTSPVAGKYYFTDRARAYGVTAGAENIAMSGGGALAVFQMWLGSPGHSANMLNPGFRTMGIGRSGSYWTQMFGN